MKVLVTGASGFIGKALCEHLIKQGVSVVAAYRNSSLQQQDGVKVVYVGNIGGDTDWSEALSGCDFVIHLAARVHVMSKEASDPVNVYRTTNTLGTINLARQALDAGVKRMIFLSSIGVNGDTSGQSMFNEGDIPQPWNPYAKSKWAAEQKLKEIAGATQLEVVIIRPPIVYGPGNPGNLLRLLRLVDRRVPFPFGCVKNCRSLIFLDNLIDAITLCVVHPQAANQTFLVSDGKDVSTPELVRVLAKGLGRPALLLPIPVWLLHLAATLLGKRVDAKRLLGSLIIDSSKIRNELDWAPPYTFSEGLHQTTAWYLTHRK